MKRLVPVLAATALLAACSGSDDAPAAADGASAQGEILEGSISDEMIPVDQVRSQSPRAASEPDETGGSSAPTSGASEAPPAAQPEPATEAAESNEDEEG
ncbi:MAG: hypothetical protein R3D99_09455 [Altererythrobacter sp.]